MKRWLEWFLGALAAGVAVAALTRKISPVGQGVVDDATPEAGSQFGPAVWSSQRRVATLAGILTARLRAHNTVLIAAALSYYAMLSIFPAAIAGVSIYGLLFDPADIESQLNDLTEALPADAAGVIGTQLEAIVDHPSAGLTVATVVGIIIALWLASAGMKGLMTGISIAYGEPETRSFPVLRGIAIVITIGTILFAAAAFALVTFLPGLLSNVGLGSGWERTVTIVRWPAILLFVIPFLGLLYKIAPNRPAHDVPFFTIGAAVAASLWLIVTVGLSFYANILGNFNETYGTLGGVIVLMLWFFLSGLMFLLGAELNDELEERGIRTG